MLIAKHKAPTVSPMGVTVFEKDSASDEWIVGSFSGLYRWNIMSGRVVDYFSHKPNKQTTMRPVSNSQVSGYSNDFSLGNPIVFDYTKEPQRNCRCLQRLPMLRCRYGIWR